ncbi:MAG: hypothetical protein EUB_02926 [Eubacterium sp.]|uniref:O-antigen ligase family protein n=1 Tax=Eubacterium sp. TaxID=142586 RepID=UPI0030262E40
MKNNIQIDNKEYIFIAFIFLISLLGNAGLLLFFLLILFFLKQKEVGALNILVLITFRTILNPGLGKSVDQLQILKWIYIFSLSIYLISFWNKTNKDKINKVIIPIVIFFIICEFVNFFVSSLPIVATFKLMSFIIPFVGTIIGINVSIKKYNWIRWMRKIVCSIILFSIPLAVLPVGYLRNGYSFQGITNQPNMLGIIIVLSVALYITDFQVNNDIKIWKIVTFLFIAFIEVVLCRARTAMLAMFVCIIFFIILANIKRDKKILFLMGIAFVALCIYWINGSEIIKFFSDFFTKGNNNSILYSRENQLNNLISNIKRSPIWGNGFSVPVLNYRSWEISFKYVMEPGNIILAVISYCGIVGFISFCGMLFTIFKQNYKNWKSCILLFIAPLMISMAEMVFFSTNNIAIIFYIMYGCYMFTENKERENG